MRIKAVQRVGPRVEITLGEVNTYLGSADEPPFAVIGAMDAMDALRLAILIQNSVFDALYAEHEQLREALAEADRVNGLLTRRA